MLIKNRFESKKIYINKIPMNFTDNIYNINDKGELLAELQKMIMNDDYNYNLAYCVLQEIIKLKNTKIRFVKNDVTSSHQSQQNFYTISFFNPKNNNFNIIRLSKYNYLDYKDIKFLIDLYYTKIQKYNLKGA